jgi:hypothetical protein
MRFHVVCPVVAVACFGFAVARPALAQGPPLAIVRVHVTDTARAPLRDVDLAVVKNGTEMVLMGRTDAAGRYTVRFDPESAQYRLVVRRVGYVQTTRLLPVAPRDTLAVEISLARLPPALDTVRTEAERLPLAKQPYVGAEEIERDTRAIFNLRDVLGKLRPDINYQDFAGSRCPSSATPAPSSRGNIRMRPASLGSIRVYANGQWVFPTPGFSPLSEMHSEHILELHFVTCLDGSIPGLAPKSWASVYLTLKPGVAWDVKRGSYIADSAVYLAAERERLGSAIPPR